MSVRESYRDFVVEQLGRVRTVTWRKMFGGIGLYADGLFFALIDNDTVYFRTADNNRMSFVERGMGAFQPMGPGTKPMNYHELPGDVLEHPPTLAVWMAAALTAARTPGRQKSSKPKQNKPR